MRRLALALPFLLLACQSAGPYGFSRSYRPLNAEEAAAQGSREFDPVMAARDKDEWANKTVSLFGIVKARTGAPDGGAYLTLSMRTLSERNLCDDVDEDSCRVTVSEHEHAVVHATVRPTSEDAVGEHSIGTGSLVRVIGKLGSDSDPSDGTPVVRASYYRHWPRNFFVTTADSTHMHR
jgi:hypothetical protein